MKELSKKKYVTLITIMILVLGIIGIINVGNVDLNKGKVKIKSASIEKLKSSVIEAKGYEEITYPVLYELEKVEGIEERNVIIKGTLTKEENKYARFKEITSKTITSTVSENGRKIEIRIEKVKLGRQNKINIKIEINGAINETKIKPEIEIKEESEEKYTKINTEEIEVKTNSVTGIVQDEEGMSVSNLELSINKGNEEIRRTYTDENGRYVFSDLEEGKYIIKVLEENYEIKEQSGGTMMSENRYELNKNLAQMLKGGVIMDVTTPEQARIAQEAGACAVMALERIPADIRAAGGVSRMSDPKMIKGIQEAVTIPVMAKCRIGHFVEAQILEAIEIDYIDESEVLSPADDIYHIDKTKFKVPFVCGARDLGEALRRIEEGASMIRTKGEPGTGDVVQAVRHMGAMNSEIRRIVGMAEDEIYEAAKQLQVPVELVRYVHENGKLPVVNFAAGGVATPADAALMMQLGAEGVFVGSGIFKSGNPAKRAAAIVKAVTNYQDAKLIAELSEDLGEAMVGINESEIEILMAERGK